MARIQLIEKIQESIKASGENPFHVVGESSYSYSRLDQESASLAEELSQKVPRNTPIMIYGHKDHGMLTSILACLRSGHPYVPADEILPADRVKAMAKVAGCALVILAGKKELTEEFLGVPVISASELSRIRAKNPVSRTWKNAVRPDENVYILFTSGSTGTPKGVQITRANLESFLEWTIPAFGYASGSPGFLNQAPFHFDLSVYELYNALATGGCLYSLHQEATADQKLLFELLRMYREKLNVWVSTPSFLGYCLSDPDCAQDLFPKLREFVLIGEVLPVGMARETLRRFPKARLLNFYGPTEATVAHTVFEVTAESLEKHSSVPIGFSKPDSKVTFDHGEIILSGANVSKGYVNQPALTAERFFNGPDGWSYRTGDLGQQDDTGLLFYAGRVDNQIKVNGYRVELEDVESHLLKVPGVEACAVVPKWEQDKVEFLAAFLVVPAKELALSDLEFRKKMRAELAKFVPPYMLPKKFFRLASIPLTPNGKVDKAALKGFL